MQLADQAGDAAPVQQLAAKFVEKFPDSPLVASARATAGRSLTERTNAVEQQLAAARKLEQSDQREAALAAYLQFLREHESAAQLLGALLAAGRLHDELNQDREADAVLKRLVDQHPEFVRIDAALYQWAWVLLDLERGDDALACFARLHNDHRDSRFWPDATYRLAELKLRNKAYDEAARVIETLIEAQPEPDLLCHSLFLQGQTAATAQRWGDVHKPLTRLIKEFPKSDVRLLAEYWLAEADYRAGNLGEAGVRLGDLSLRIKDCNETWIAMIPLRQAQVLAHEKRWAEAREMAETIHKQFPDFRQQYEVDYLLGRCWGAEAKFNAAREAYERVIRSPLGGRTETAAMAQWMIGETYFQQEKYDEAIAAYHKVARLYAFERWQAAALLQAGKCHETQSQWREAIQLYAQLLREHPRTDHTDEAAQRLRVAQQRSSARQE
jgi:TolA-binding protein